MTKKELQEKYRQLMVQVANIKADLYQQPYGIMYMANYSPPPVEERTLAASGCYSLINRVNAMEVLLDNLIQHLGLQFYEEKVPTTKKQGFKKIAKKKVT